MQDKMDSPGVIDAPRLHGPADLPAVSELVEKVLVPAVTVAVPKAVVPS